MANFYDSLKKLVPSDLVNKAAKSVGEKPENVSKAVDMIIPGLLAMYLKKHSPQVNNTLREAGRLDIISNVEDVCDEKETEEQRRVSDTFLQDVLGDQAADFTNPIASQAGISKVAGNRLVSMIGVVVAGYLGEKLVKDKWSITQLLNEIASYKDKFKKEIPTELTKLLDLNYIMNSPQPEKKSNAWLWIVIILLLALLGFWGWKSCNTEKVKEVETAVTEEVHKIEQDVKNTVEPVMDQINGDLEMKEITLPDGFKIHVKKGGVEESMVNYLNSDVYKNATNEDLEKKWFEFNALAFEFGSTTDLKPGANIVLDNIAAILKTYPNAKVGIIGFADKKGTEAVNMEVSKERAAAVEKMLDMRGIGNQIEKADGYGEQYAKHSVLETDVQRAPDRDIALRFIK